MLNDLIKQKRQAMGLTQAQLASKCGTTRQTVYNVERKGVASVDTLRKLGVALNIQELKVL